MKDNFKLEELFKLIEICNNNNVTQFKLDDLDIIFKETRVPKDKVSCEVPSMVDLKPSPAPEHIEEVDPAILRQLEADIKQAQLDQMMINDPVQFEELLDAGDYEYGRDADSTEVQA